MKKYRYFKWFCMIMLTMLCCVADLPPKAFSAEEKTKKETIRLSEEEQAFIREKKELIIGCATENCPLLYQEEDGGELQGIAIDILDMVSEATGFTFRYQALPPGNVSYQDLQRLQVDLVASVECNSVNEQYPGIVLTESYLQAEKVFVCKKGVVFEKDKNMVIAIASGSQTLEEIIRKKYPNFEIEFYNSTEDALSALLSGKADAVLQNQYTMERILAKPKYENLQIVATATAGDAHCLACLVPINEARQSVVTEETKRLVAILNKGIESLDKSQVSFIVIKETAENSYKLTAWDFLYRYRYAVVAIVISLLLIFVLLWKNHTLQKKRSEQLAAEQRAKELSVINEQMREQQILLKDALEQAEQGNEAKNSFLFNMSHDIRTPMNAILGFAEIAYKNRDNKEKLTDSLDKIEKSSNHLMQLINEILDMSRIESGKITLTENACNLVEIIEKVRDIFQAELKKKDVTLRVDVSQVTNEWVYCDSLRVNQILLNLVSNAVKFSKPDGVITIQLYQDQSDMKGYASYKLCVKDTGIGMSKEFQTHIFEAFEREHTSTVSKTQGTGLGMTITKNLVDLMGGTIDVHSEPDKGTEFILHFTFKIEDNLHDREREGTLEQLEQKQ